MNEKRYRAAEQQFWEYYGTSTTERWLHLTKPATNVRVQELGEGLPLLFLHGGPGAGTIFAPLASHLKDFRCILLDRPGCGLSPAITYSKARLDETMVDIVRSVVTGLGLDRVSLVTSSIGGSCAFWFVSRHPEFMTRIVHLGCPAFVSQMHMPLMLKIMATPGLGYLAARLPMNRTGVVQFLKTMGQHQALAHNRIPDEFFNWWISLAQDTETMRNERELIRQGLIWKGMRPEFVIADKTIQAVETPTYFYWGEDEPFATTDFAQKLVRGMKKANLDIIAGSGHLTWFDDPRDASKRVRLSLQQELRDSVATRDLRT